MTTEILLANKYTATPLPSNDVLLAMYNVKKMTQVEIARHFGVSQKVVSRWMKVSRIPQRKPRDSYRKGNPADRFWSKVKTPLGIAECWEWIGSKNVDGYGQFGLEGKIIGAYRFAYEQLIGPIPDGMELDHLCRNTSCVNPYHLEPVSHRENMLRGLNSIADNAKKTHCPKGHPLSGDNLIASQLARGRRNCKACRDEARRG